MIASHGITALNGVRALNALTVDWEALLLLATRPSAFLDKPMDMAKRADPHSRSYSKAQFASQARAKSFYPAVIITLIAFSLIRFL